MTATPTPRDVLDAREIIMENNRRTDVTLSDLIADKLAERVAEERARCAEIADQRANICFGTAKADDDPSERCAGIEAAHIAELIRARTNK